MGSGFQPLFEAGCLVKRLSSQAYLTREFNSLGAFSGIISVVRESVKQ